MITSKKRGKFEIYGDMLEAIEAEAAWEGARLTRVQAKSNLAYDRFKSDLAVLEQRGLVKLAPEEEGHVSIALTQPGKEYLERYREVKRFMVTYGL